MVCLFHITPQTHHVRTHKNISLPDITPPPPQPYWIYRLNVRTSFMLILTYNFLYICCPKKNRPTTASEVNEREGNAFMKIIFYPAFIIVRAKCYCF